jgi:tetratricopeptide (TPR) repeat protein
MRSSALALVCAAAVLSPIAIHGDESPDDLMRQGHWKRVRDIAQARYQAAPGSADANYLMGSVAYKWGQYDSAQQYAEKAVQLAPQNAAYHWLLAQVLGDQAERASIFKQMGLAKRFRSETETVIRLDPRHIDAHVGLMLYYFKAPGIVGGDKKKAFAETETIGAIDRAKGYMAQARLAQEEQQLGKLEGLYQSALAANPKDYEALIGLFNVYAGQQRRNIPEAESLARRALEADAGRIGGYTALSVALVMQRKWSDLDAHLAAAEKAIPDNLSPFYVAAASLVREGQDFPRAERYYRKYLSIEREAGGATHAVVQWRLGLLLELQNRKPEAVAALETAVKLDPSFEQARKDLKRLKG